MSTTDNKFEHRFSRFHNRPKHPAGRVLAGLWVIAIGVAFLLKKAGVFFPDWVFSFPMLIIAIGVFVGAKRLFRGAGWFIVVLVGSAFMAERMIPDLSLTKFVWPAVIILVGVAMVFGSRKKKWDARKWENCGNMPGDISSEDVVSGTAVFGGIKKNVISKNFKGGNVECVFGGAEINLSQADIQGTVTLDCTQVFGGAKLIVPANWSVRHEMTAILGGIEDNRMKNNQTEDPSKVLVLRGAVVFGGIEISNY